MSENLLVLVFGFEHLGLVLKVACMKSALLSAKALVVVTTGLHAVSLLNMATIVL